MTLSGYRTVIQFSGVGLRSSVLSGRSVSDTSSALTLECTSPGGSAETAQPQPRPTTDGDPL